MDTKSSIKPFDYTSALELKSNIFPHNIVALASLYDGKIITESNNYIDLIIYNYIKYRPNITILTFYFTLEDKCLSNLTNFLSENGDIYHIKYIQLSQKAIASLIYQMNKGNDKNYDFIINNCPRIPPNEELTVIFYDNNNHQGKLFNLLELSIEQIVDKRMFHMTKEYGDTLRLSQIYLNGNSLAFLEHQLLERYMQSHYDKTRNMLIKLGKWIEDNIDINDRENYVIYGGLLMSVYGLKNTKNIYIFTDNVKEWEKNNLDFVSLETHNFRNNIWLNNLYIPKCYFYFMGLKFMNLNQYIIKQRSNTNLLHYTDLLMINDKLNKNIELPNIKPDYTEIRKIISKFYNEWRSTDDIKNMTSKNNIHLLIKKKLKKKLKK